MIVIMVRVLPPNHEDIELHIEADSNDEAFDIAWDRAMAIGKDWWEGLYRPDYSGVK